MLTEMVAGVVDRLQIEAEIPGSQLEEHFVDLITETAVRVRDDAALQVRIEQAIEATIDRAMTRFGADIDALVTGTIASWDADRHGRPTGAAARPATCSTSASTARWWVPSPGS